jgi:hypothetical protein
LLASTVVGTLRALAADPAGQLDVLGEDGDAFGVDGAEVGVLEETYQVRLTGLLEGHDGRGLEAEFGLEVRGDLADEALEGELTEEELGRLLVASDFAESDGAGPISVGFLHSSGDRGALAGGLGGEGLAGGLATGGLASCLLRACHFKIVRDEAGKFWREPNQPNSHGTRVQLL